MITPVQAADLGISQNLTVEGNGVTPGKIVSYANGAFHLSSEPFDKGMFGVIATDPAIAVSFEGETNTVPVMNNGVVDVLVNSENGPIHKGDQITSSSTPGVGMRADKSGFMLGIAQGDFISTDKNATSSIPVSLDIKFAFAAETPQSTQIARRLVDVVKLSGVAIAEEPIKVLRYVVAALVTLGTLIFGFLSFARLARTGTEALARNPLAQHQIMIGMFLNVTIAIAILMSGLGTAYFIIRL